MLVRDAGRPPTVLQIPVGLGDPSCNLPNGPNCSSRVNGPWFSCELARAGAVALALIVIPIVVRTTENMLNLVPNTLREAAYALGTPKWKLISTVTLKAAKAGLTTGVLLAFARITGETAPLLFTALNNQYFSTDMSQPMANLPNTIYQFAMSPYDNWHALAWAAALLITMTVLIVNILARFIGGKDHTR